MGKKIINKFRLFILSAFSGVLAGSASALFLSLLTWATDYRDNNLWIISALPIAGFFIGWCYFRFGKESDAGNSLIIDEVHDPQKKIPLRMAPFVLIGTVLTHLFGGSAGREGTAVQMGASLAEKLGEIFKVGSTERRTLLVTGMGAGFGSAIGAPWAGVIFGLEVLSIGQFHFFALIECFIASMVAYYTVGFWGVEHTQYIRPLIPSFNTHLLFAVLISAFVFGSAAFVFTKAIHFIQMQSKKLISYPALRPFFGGIILVILFWLEGSYRYSGLGLSVIQESLHGISLNVDPFFKTIFTALTVGTGFKGGEFIPLVFIGSTLGSILGVALKVGAGFLAALGFAAVFGAAANTPIACAIMGIEIFGLGYAPYMIVVCFLSYLFSGHRGIYKAQRIAAYKHRHLIRFYRWYKKPNGDV